MVPLNLPLFKSVVGHKTNLLVNQNTTIFSLFGLVGVALAKNPFASLSSLVIVSKVFNIFFFSGFLFFATKQRQVINFLSDYVVDYVIELYDTYIGFSDRYI
jgi:hypothetical protein